MNRYEYDIEIQKTLHITSEDIDDIMAAALEGGINYWCNEVKAVGLFLGQYASEQISRGGALELYDAEEGEIYKLTLNDLLKGIKLAYEQEYFLDYNWCNGNELDTCQIDAEVADVIIQLALFGEVVYG